MRVGEIFSLGGGCGHDEDHGHHYKHHDSGYGHGYKHYSYGGYSHGYKHYSYGGYSHGYKHYGYHRGGLLGIRISL